MLEEKISSFSECIKRPERLQERIAKQKMPTFETELRREKKIGNAVEKLIQPALCA